MHVKKHPRFCLFMRKIALNYGILLQKATEVCLVYIGNSDYLKFKSRYLKSVNNYLSYQKRYVEMNT